MKKFTASNKLSTTLGGVTLFGLLSIITLFAPGKVTVAAQTSSTTNGVTHPYPERQALAPTGSEFLAMTAKMNQTQREEAIFNEIAEGNVPDHVRALVPVEIRYQEHRATIFVTPDYLAIGSNDDYVVIPMMPRTAMRIANEFGYTLPTRKMVDDIHSSSDQQLTPDPMYPGPKMASNAYYEEHDCKIKSQLSDADTHSHDTSYELVAGHKKDLVVTPRLVSQPDRVAIYGWHYPDGRPIQPLSLVHEVDYVDYSHGVRLVSRIAIVDGEVVDLMQLYADSELNPLISDEGRIPTRFYL